MNTSPSNHTQSIDDWLTPRRFALMLAMLVFFCFPDVLTGMGTFFYRDFAFFGYPLAFHHREAFWNGEMPLWNPLNNFGLPFLAQWNTLTLYPLSLFYLIFPLSWSLGVFCLLHMFLGGMGMYFLAYRWSGNRLAASLAGVIFAFNGLTASALMWPNNMAALGWMPWVVLAVEAACREGGRRRIALAALAGAMQMLAGAPEVILFTWCIAGAIWLSQLMTAPPRVAMLARFLSILVLVAGLAACQLLPFLDLLAHSQRNTDFATSNWAMPATGLVNYLVPLFHHFGSVQGTYYQLNQYWISSYYVGAGTIALALLVAWRFRNRKTWVLIAVAAVSLCMAMGDNALVYGWLKRAVPQLGFMRFPIKFVVMATFCFPLLAACAVAWLRTLTPAQWSLERPKILTLGAALLGLIGIASFFAWKQPLNLADPDFPYDIPGTLANALFRAIFLVAILGSLIALCSARSPRLQQVLGICLILLVWFDLAIHSPHLSPTVERVVYQPDMIRQYMKWDAQLQPGESRAMPTRKAFMKMQFGTVAQASAEVSGRRLALFSNNNLLDHVSKVDGFFSLYLREPDALGTCLLAMTNGLATLKDFLGVSYISHPTNSLEWLARDTWMPMMTAGQKPVFTDDVTAFQGMIRDDFEPAKIVYLPAMARSAVTATNQAEAKIVSRKFSAHQLTAEVVASAPAMVVVAQAFYHPWHAYVDGKEVALWRANYAFQALEVPAGQHQIRIAYEDRSFKWGVVISIIALMSCLGLLARAFRVKSLGVRG